MNNTKIIAVSGASGAGKTTIIQQLAKRFNSPFLLFDDYTDNDTYPDDMKNWLKNGVNVSLIKTPRFVRALDELISKNTSAYIFIEEPFGKGRYSLSHLIDYVVLLDQPLELCLMRIIKRHTDHPNSNSLNRIASFLVKYEDYLRDIYISAVSQVRKDSDLIISEALSVKETTSQIDQWLNTIER